MTNFKSPKWTKSLTIKRTNVRHSFAARLKEVTKELILQELGPEYYAIREEALAIALGEVADFLETDYTVSDKTYRKVNNEIDQMMPLIKKKIDSGDDLNIHIPCINPFQDWHF
jgi:hypothetical protein